MGDLAEMKEQWPCAHIVIDRQGCKAQMFSTDYIGCHE